MRHSILDTAEYETDRYKLPEGLILAFVKVESNGEPWVWNPEPRYRYLVDAKTNKPFRKLTQEEIDSETPPRDFPRNPHTREARDAEWWGQQASWGVLQVMGAVAREYGFKRSFPFLCDPAVCIRYGAIHLKRLMRFEKKHGIDGVISAYNAGSPTDANEAYVAKVRKAWEKFGG